MDDSRDSLPYVNPDTVGEDGYNEVPSQDSEVHMASSPHLDQDTKFFDVDREMFSHNSETHHMCSETHHIASYVNQNTECCDGGNKMPSQGSEVHMASPPHSDQGTEIYDVDREMLSHDSETDTASEGSKSSEMSTASPFSEESLDDKANDADCSSSSNEGSSYDDRVNTKYADRDSLDASIEGSNDNDEYVPLEFPEIIMCDICFKKFEDIEQKWAHHRIPSPPISYICNKCDSEFHTECRFEYHRSFEHTPDIFSPEKQK